MVFADKNVRTKALVVETEPVFQITPAAASLCAVLRGFFSSALGIFMQKKLSHYSGFDENNIKCMGKF